MHLKEERSYLLIYLLVFFYHCIIGSSELYASKLKEKYLGDIPIYSPFYGATEGLIGVNLWPEEENPVYMLVPRAMFFEFIPVDESGEDQPTVCTPCNFSIAVKLLIFFFCLEIFIYLSLIMALV